MTHQPMDMPIGRFSGLIDPQGAPFTVMRLARPPADNHHPAGRRSAGGAPPAGRM